ncbi:glycosyltransferase family 9 protein [Streptomyces sp. DSM 118878]
MKALVVCPDSMSGVLLAGPAVRAVAASADHVTVACGPRGAPAARLLPGADDVLVPRAPWEGEGPPPVDDADPDGPLRRLAEAAFDVALVLASPRESPLPAALLRAARVPRVGGDGTARDAEAALDSAAALGFHPRRGDDGRLRVHPGPDTTGLTGNGPYVVLHPGAGGPARAGGAERAAEVVALLADGGHRVVVTGGPEETGLTRRVSGDIAVDLGGRTDVRTLSGVLRAADAVIAGRTGPAYLAAAAGAPVVSGSRGTALDVVRTVQKLLARRTA